MQEIVSSNEVKLLASYVDALRPIIYINHFDFDAVDTLISKVSLQGSVNEYNDAGGLVDFKYKNSKLGKSSHDLETVLSLFDLEDNIDTFLVLKDIHHYLENPRIIALLKSIALKTVNRHKFRVTILIVSSRLLIPEELSSLITILDIPLPRISQIKKLIEDFSEHLDIKISGSLIDELSLSFKGLSEFNITQILNLAYQNGGCIDKNDKSLIVQEKEQIIRKTGALEILNFNETIDDIGGLKDMKSWLKKKAKIFKDLDSAIKFGVDPPKGIMIVGMPGCGKSLVAKATSRLFEVSLLRLDVGKLLGKYVGESEENFRQAIEIAEAASPCILWIDEIEKAFAGIGQSDGGSGVTTRLFGSFLTWLQEKENMVFVVATANDITSFPPEFLRKGRFDELFSVDFPNKEERQKIFDIHLRKRGKWHKDINIASLVGKTVGYSGADIEAVVKEAIENAFFSEEKVVTTNDLLEVIEVTTPLSQTLSDKIKKIKEELDRLNLKPASRGEQP